MQLICSAVVGHIAVMLMAGSNRNPVMVVVRNNSMCQYDCTGKQYEKRRYCFLNAIIHATVCNVKMQRQESF